jgi:hypothetical protein
MVSGISEWLSARKNRNYRTRGMDAWNLLAKIPYEQLFLGLVAQTGKIGPRFQTVPIADRQGR